MTDLLGKKLVTLIVVCLLLIMGLGATLYYYVLPQQEKLEAESQSLQAKAREKQAEIDKMRFEFAEIQKQIDQFKILEAKRFFNAQDRITARDAISTLVRGAKLIDTGTEVSLRPAALVPNVNADKAGYKLISGPMSIRFAALNDINAYKFILLLEKAFPGYLQMKSFQIQRDASDLDAKIGGLMQGTESALVSGSANFAWWTMASEAQLQADPKLNPVNVTTDPTDPALQGQPQP